MKDKKDKRVKIWRGELREVLGFFGSSLTIRCKLAHKLHVPFKKGGNYDV